jgi:tRNA wybutosine-synthesizing protein 3
MGLSFESLIGYQMGDRRVSLVSTDYLRILMSIATERFAENTKRIERFLSAFRDAISTPSSTRRNPDGQEWEDAAERRERKRAEGLRRKAELQAGKAKQDTTLSEPGEANVDQTSSFLPDS